MKYPLSRTVPEKMTFIFLKTRKKVRKSDLMTLSISTLAFGTEFEIPLHENKKLNYTYHLKNGG